MGQIVDFPHWLKDIKILPDIDGMDGATFACDYESTDEIREAAEAQLDQTAEQIIGGQGDGSLVPLFVLTFCDCCDIKEPR